MICLENECTGCSACLNICEQNAITMVQDKYGFYRPVIDEQVCTNCERCVKGCPINSNQTTNENSTPLAYTAYSFDMEERIFSSSGGIFSLLAHYILNNNGVVFGAAFDEEFQVHHTCIENEKDLSLLRGSKYVQSRIENTFLQAKEILQSGRLVLFSGTPCQIEGLLSYLGKSYENLYTQDLICHGVPSPMVWEKYINYRENIAASKTRRIFSRHKKYGWKRYSVSFEFANDTEYLNTYNEDLFMKSFLQNYSLRQSCYDCKFKKMNRVSDITLADFWGIQKSNPEMDDDNGTSLVIIHSEKGKNLWDKIKDNAEYKEVDVNAAIIGNPSMTESAKKPNEAEDFMNDIQHMEFDKCADKYFYNNKKERENSIYKQGIHESKKRKFCKEIIKNKNNKKIGIITLYGLFNYGNRLQNYAVHKVLSKMGYDAVTYTCNPEPQPIEQKRYWKWQLHELTNFQFKKNRKTWKNKHGRYYAFFEFTRKYIPTKHIISPRVVAEKADYFVVGSDQVWNPIWYQDYDKEMFFLTFADSNQKICFSPSFGISALPEEWKEWFKRYLPTFPNMSVREQAGADIIKELTGKQAEVLIDPTMMLTKNDWLKIARKPRNVDTKRPYILTYFLGDRPEQAVNDIGKIQKQKTEEVYYLIDKNQADVYACGPREFVYMVSKADIVLTDSFHACVFSTLFNRPFIVYDREEKGCPVMNSRMDTFLGTFGLANRHRNNMNDEEFFLMNNQEFLVKCEIEKEKVNNFLYNSLNQNK